MLGRVKKLEKNIKIKLNIFSPLPPGNDNSVFSNICYSRFNWAAPLYKKRMGLIDVIQTGT